MCITVCVGIDTSWATNRAMGEIPKLCMDEDHQQHPTKPKHATQLLQRPPAFHLPQPQPPDRLFPLIFQARICESCRTVANHGGWLQTRISAEEHVGIQKIRETMGDLRKTQHVNTPPDPSTNSSEASYNLLQ